MKGGVFYAFALSLTGCVAQDAGYQDVRQLVAERAAKDVRWQHIDGAGVAEDKTRELLAKPLSAESAVQIALLNNPGLQASFEELGIARAGLVKAYRIPNPTVEASLHHHTSPSQTDVDVFLTESVSAFFFMPYRAGAAQAELDAAKLGVGGAALDLALDVKTTYYRYIAAVQVLELRKSVLSASSASYDAAKALHDAGNNTDLDLANEQALYSEARLGVANAETALATERERLGALLGLFGGDAQWKTEQRLREPSDEKLDAVALERRTVERSIDLEQHRRRFTAAAKRANLANAEGWLPDLRAGVAASKDERNWGFGPAAALELPLFYQGQGEVAEARAEMRREQQSYANVALELRGALRSVLSRLETARDTVRFYKREILPLREKIVSETMLEYNAMHVGVFQLLQAKRDQIEAGRAFVEALRDYWIARAELDQLLAGRLTHTAVGELH